MREETKLVSLGRHPQEQGGAVNPPVYHVSTVLFPTMEQLLERHNRPPKSMVYGLYGSPTTFTLREALAEIEGGYDTAIFPSGLAAIAVPLMAYLKAGDHLLMLDSVYGPTRRFCDNQLKRFGVETTYYDPLVGAGIKDLIRPETKVIFLESPGSLTFEIQDVPAITAVARKRGIVTLLDNTWATPLLFKPFEHGVDVSIQAATKYIAGHSDLLMGTVTTTKEAWPALNAAVRDFGQAAGPDDCFMALRGLRTMAVRLKRHEETGLILARWLEARPEVERLLHPALPSHPGHEIWKRDFLGACGLFGFSLKPCSQKALAAMFNGYKLFGMGYSWGGFESLILPANPGITRTATCWGCAGMTVRVHAGLEDPRDLIEDLEAGFERLNSTEE